MLDTSVREALAARIKKAQLVYLMLLSSLLVYLLMGYPLTQGQRPSSLASIDLVVMILGTVGLATLVASFALRNLFLRKAFGDLPAKITEDHVGDVASAAFTPWVLGWSLCEAVAIFGLIPFVLTFRWELFLPFWTAGLGALLAQAPTVRSLELALERR